MNFLINGGKYGEKGQIEKHEFYPSYLTVCEMRRCFNEYEKDYTPKLNIVLNDDYSTSTEKAVTLIQSENTEVPFSVTDMNVILKLDDFANVTDEPLGNETSSEMAVKEQHELSFVNMHKHVIGCPLEHQDFSICKNYFNEYLASVSQWGKKYNRPVKHIMIMLFQACALLSEVPYLSTACCTIFNETCTVHMKIIKNNNEIYI
ncbi:unnamed protein product [Thelazia callipaeda]|uniref:Maelstrom domain-containing protein n=1 Tax=Thelazia callipaeda TaxID=103827 RepID=A0A0N5D3M2_THECL|nr:unnamed protein product [Thelazia callipaeda]